MDKYVSTLKEQVLRNILKIEKTECTMLQKSDLIIPQLEKSFGELKLFIIDYTFKDDTEEIRFFKEIKPQLFSQLSFYSRVYDLEMKIPTGSLDDQKMYLRRVQDQIKYFFDMNLDFYQYYRSGSIYLDHFYFLRKKPDIRQIPDCFHFERDNNFSTCYDFKVTEIPANDSLQQGAVIILSVSL